MHFQGLHSLRCSASMIEDGIFDFVGSQNHDWMVGYALRLLGKMTGE
jgi:hypothetical protein